MIYLVAFVVLVLATARLTRLTYFDDITIPLRVWIDSTFGPNSFISKVIWCPWCASVWWSMFTCAVALAGAWAWMGVKPAVAVGAFILAVPAVAYPAGWLVDFETTRTSKGQ